MKRAIGFIVLFLVFVSPRVRADWKPVEGRIMTRWSRQVNPDNVWKEYPRPQLVRDNWMNRTKNTSLEVDADSNSVPYLQGGNMNIRS